MFVRPEHRKLGYFRALYNKVVEIAKQDPLGQSVRLYVDKENTNAQQVYSKLGMQVFGNYNFDEIDFHFSH